MLEKCRRATGTITQANRTIATNNNPPTSHSLLPAIPAMTDDETFAGAGAAADFSDGLVSTEACGVFCSLEADEACESSTPTGYAADLDSPDTAADSDTDCCV